jgi:hypothetical protein
MFRSIRGYGRKREQSEYRKNPKTSCTSPVKRTKNRWEETTKPSTLGGMDFVARDVWALLLELLPASRFVGVHSVSIITPCSGTGFDSARQVLYARVD